ncbi:acyl-CoA dehydratase activase [Chloroflexota bacterium]
MIITAGVDIGSAGTKALILRDDKTMDWSIIPTTGDSSESAEIAMNQVLNDTSLSLDDIDYIVSTGYGRVNVPFAQKTITEITCHAAGAHWLFPEVRTILDVGGQDVKAIKCDEKGAVVNFVLNDKCAAGTGRYLEWTAAAFNMDVGQLGHLALQSTRKPPLVIESTCTVFAREDMVKLLRHGEDVKDILAGALRALAGRLCSFVNRVGVEESIILTGGVAKNIALFTFIEEELGITTIKAPEPQIMGALGAAILADRELSGLRQER